LINSDKIIIQLSVYLITDDYEVLIQGLNGSFDFDHMMAFLNIKNQYYGSVYSAIEKEYGKIAEATYSVYAEIKFCESETQYGTGYGDILVLPAYYYIGEVLEMTQHFDVEVFENELIEQTCVKCKGEGFHHGFGEHGHDPDHCTDCGGSGVSFESEEVIK